MKSFLAKTETKTKKKADSFWIAGRGYDKKVIALVPKAKLLFQEVRVRSGETIPPHYHARSNEHFFVFEAKPKTKFLIGKKWFALNAGDYFVVKARTIHAVDASKIRGRGTAATFFVVKENFAGDDSVWMKS